MGIEKEHLPKVFGRFYQVDKSRTAEGGEGLFLLRSGLLTNIRGK
ncbi:hypothetical protein [Metabacillus fastidiosus]